MSLPKDKSATDYFRDTRLGWRSGRMETPDLELTKDSFRWRAMREYNKLPAELRRQSLVSAFKTELWRWIKVNISIG